MRFVADTHALLWYLLDSPRLSATARALFDGSTDFGNIVLPTIVLAELLYISKKSGDRLSFKKVFHFLEEDERFTIQPLSSAIIKAAIPLDHFEMHDALIMATALDGALALMTRDEEIVRSGIVATITP